MSISRVAVVGGGIVGVAVAREIGLRLPEAEVTVFDKADRLAAHQSGHTSGIVHAGLDEVPGSPGAELSRRGVELLVPYVSVRGIPYRECGQLVVAQDTDGADRLEEMLARAQANGVPGVRLVDRAEMREIEPHARGVLALYSPHTAITDFIALTEALASDVRAAGGTFRLRTEVTGIDAMSNEVRVRIRAEEPPAPEHTGPADSGNRSGHRADTDEEVHEVPRTYRGGDPVLEVGDGTGSGKSFGEEMRDRFGDKDWFRQVEEKVDQWSGRVPGSGGPGGADGDRGSKAPAEVDAGTYDLVIVAAGLQADRLAVATGLDPDPRVVPFTSSYFVVGEPAAELVRGIISSVPDPKAPFLETTLARSVSGSLLLGPNTYLSLARESYDKHEMDFGDIGSTLGFKGFWKFASQNLKSAAQGARTAATASAFVDKLRAYVPELDADSIKPGPRGVRAHTINSAGDLVDDLLVTTRGRLTEVRNVPGTGAASALAVAERIVDQALKSL